MLITLILKSAVARQDIEVKTLVSLEKFQFSRGSDGDK